MRLKNYLTSLFIILSVISILQIASAVEVVEVPKDQATTQQTGFSFFGFLKSPSFWTALVIGALILLFCFLLFLLARWLIKFIKQRNDVFWRLKEERISLAKVHRRYGSTHWWKVEKNTPIRLVKKDDNGKLIVSKTIGHHRGDCYTHEGNLTIWLNLIGKKQYMILPASDLLIIPNKEKVVMTQRNEKGEKVREEEFKLPLAKDIIQFNEDEILIFAEGLSTVGMFLIPVLKSPDGKIIDLALPIYSSLKDVVLGDYLYEVNSEFVALSKKAMDLNPLIRGIQKVGDPNQNVQIDQTGR